MPFDPDQPRDSQGRWTDGGAETSTLPDASNAIRFAASDLKKVKLPVDPNPLLTPEQKRIETKFTEYLEENFYQLQERYLSDPNLSGPHGNIIAADNVKELSPDYSQNNQSRAELASVVHEPSSAFTKLLYENVLRRPPVSGNVVFTAGGTGAGKTSSISNVGEIQSLSDKADVVYDSNLATPSSAKKKIQQAIDSGRDVSVIFVHREIEEAFKNGVLPRMKKVGRSIPISEHVKKTFGALETVTELRSAFSHNNKVHFRFIDNSLGSGNAREASFESVIKKAYLRSESEVF